MLTTWLYHELCHQKDPNASQPPLRCECARLVSHEHAVITSIDTLYMRQCEAPLHLPRRSMLQLHQQREA
eukprot:1170878-Amphidinium_carterae.2